MTRRLFYHFFWNFYDYLGAYTVYGAGFTLPLLFLAMAGVFAAGRVGSPAGGLVLLVLTALVLILYAALATGGFYRYASIAARDEPARWADFRLGMRRHLKVYLKLLLVVAVAVTLIVANINFYSRFAASGGSGGASLGFMVASMIFFWVGVALWLFLHPALVAPAWFDEPARLRPAMRKAVILFVLAPGFWIGVAIFFLVLLALCVLSVIGVLFILPILATLSATAFSIVVRHADYLGEARAEMGDGRSVREYKRRAIEMASEWEYQQPRRTFRELIKPWEM
jgi:hypothetical protein